MSAPETVENTMSRDDYMRLLRERNNFAAERDALAARVERLDGRAPLLVIIKPGEAGLFHATSPDMPGLFVSGTSVEEVSAAVPKVIAALSTAQGPQEG
jgi:hypothetical protein